MFYHLKYNRLLNLKLENLTQKMLIHLNNQIMIIKIENH